MKGNTEFTEKNYLIPNWRNIDYSMAKQGKWYEKSNARENAHRSPYFMHLIGMIEDLCVNLFLCDPSSLLSALKESSAIEILACFIVGDNPEKT